MEKVFILSNVYTSENSRNLEGTKTFSMYPSLAGTKEDIDEALQRHIDNAKAERRLVEEITSEDIHAGYYFDRVVRIQSDTKWPYIYGISSVDSHTYFRKDNNE